MKRIYVIILLLSFNCFGCKDMFDDFLTEEPEVVVSNTNFWKTEKDVESAFYELYASFRGTLGHVTPRLYRDRGLPFDYLGLTWRAISNNDLRSTFDVNDSALSWLNEYRVIGQCNFILDNLHRANLPEDRENYYIGQALTIRAYMYFYIIRTWGDAVLILSEGDVGEKGVTPWKEISRVITGDLKKAATLLPVVSDLKDASGGLVVSRQVPSRGMAWAILAHVLAWQASFGDEPDLYKDGIEAATNVIKHGGFSLVKSPSEVCDVVLKGNSEEGILELDFDDKNSETNPSGSCMAGVTEKWPVVQNTLPSTRRTLLRINNTTIMEMFPDKTDKRREEYFYKLDSMSKVSTSTTQGAAYIQKFRYPLYHESGSKLGQIRAFDLNEILIRLADIYLLRAEMEAKSGHEGEAIDDLNVIRRRAGALDYSTEEGDLNEAIAREREKELFLEGICTRYFDIVRNKTFREKLRGDFKTLTDQDVLDGALFFPISTDAFYNNTKMTQNVYWKTRGFAI